MRWALPLIVILAFSTAAALIDTSPHLLSKHIHDQKEETPADDTQPQGNHNITNETTTDRSDLRPRQGAPRTDSNSSNNAKDDQKWSDGAQAWSAIAIAALTAVLIIINIKQLGHISRGTASAEKAANAAIDAAATARTALFYLERPYVFFDLIKVVRDGYALKAAFNFVNHGRTPAIIKEFGAQVLRIRSESTFDACEHYQFGGTELGMIGTVIPASGGHTKKIERSQLYGSMSPASPKPDDKMLEVIKGDVRFYLIGKISYTGALQNQVHVTSFLYWVHLYGPDFRLEEYGRPECNRRT